MKARLRAFGSRVRSWIRVHLSPLALKLSALALRNFTLGNEAYEIFYTQGFHLLRKSYYLPFPDRTEIEEDYWEKQSDLIGVEMNDESALLLLREVLPDYLEEFRRKFPLRAGSELDGFYLINGNYMAVDAHIYYAFIRHFQPQRVIEIGAGNSTLLAAAACEANRQESGLRTNLIAIDPFPRTAVQQGIPGLVELIEKPLQKVEMERFTALDKGDILFIDSTHVIKSGGDVQLEYLEILPRLAPGVLVHFHDISLPRAYPRVYFEHHLYWNEQYLLQAFLTFNSRFEVIWPGNYMLLNYPELMLDAFPELLVMREEYPQSEPSSFWMRVKPEVLE